MMPADYLEEKTNEELLEMYRRDGQLEVKQALTLRHLSIVKTIALQMRSVYAGTLQMEDIIILGKSYFESSKWLLNRANYIY